MCVQERRARIFEPGDRFFWREVDLLLPPAHGDLAGFRVHGEAKGILAQRFLQAFRELQPDELVPPACRPPGCPIHDGTSVVSGLAAKKARPIDHPLCARFKEPLPVLCRAQAAPHLAGQPFADLLNQRAVVALAHRGVEVDQLHEGIARKPLDPVLEVVERKLEGFAADELHDAAAHQVDGGNQHPPILAGRPRVPVWLPGLPAVARGL